MMSSLDFLYFIAMIAGVFPRRHMCHFSCWLIIFQADCFLVSGFQNWFIMNV